MSQHTKQRFFSTQTVGEVSQSTIPLLTGKKTAIDWFQTHSYVQPVKCFNSYKFKFEFKYDNTNQKSTRMPFFEVPWGRPVTRVVQAARSLRHAAHLCLQLAAARKIGTIAHGACALNHPPSQYSNVGPNSKHKLDPGNGMPSRNCPSADYSRGQRSR